MELDRNRFKAALAAGQTQIGLWSSLCSNIVAEIVGDSGFDWILFDTEHSPNELPGLLGQLQAAARGTATGIVRPAWNDPVLIKRILDIGAQALLIPFVQTAEEARRAVAACRYPPAGIRGITTSGRGSHYGRVTDYLKNGRYRDLRAAAGRDRRGAGADRGDRLGRRRRRRVHRPVRPVGLAGPYRQFRSIRRCRPRSRTRCGA